MRPEEPRPQYQKQHRRKNGETSHCVLENLVRPKRSIRPAYRFFRFQAVPSKKINVHTDQGDRRARQNTGVQSEESGQRVMPILGTADDESLQTGSDEWNYS